jgi:LuxR family transcriptional regulator, transcriptional regulator of spore coat protein
MLSFDQLDRRPVLSPREHQILELIAVGFSAKEVAQRVFIAPRTVERHIENIRLKMRARNRTHMVTCAAMAGMLVLRPEGLSRASNEGETRSAVRRVA